MISLYDDQEEFISTIRGLWREHLRILGMMPTGGGKTRVAARIIEGFVKNGMRVCFVVPRIALIEQTANSFAELGLEDITYIWGSCDTDPKAAITIASIDTYIRREKGDFDLTIIDEAHMRRAKLLEWMDEHPEDRYLGLTATPYYSWIGEYYTGLAKAKSMKWMIENGRLAPYEVFAPCEPDLKGVKIRQGDYAENELEAIMCGYKVVGNIVQNWLEHGEDRPTMALCVNVSHANFLCVEFNKVGVASEVITAQTPVDERHRIFKRVQDGITKVLTSVNALNEGVDLPLVSCLINARPTKSIARYVQGMGRALRYMPGKTAVIFDHSGTTIELGFPCDIDIDELPNGGSGESKESERQDTEEKPVKVPKRCGSCNYMKPAGVYVCPKCGFKPLAGEDVDVDESRGLKKLKGKKKKEYTQEDKTVFYAGLLGWQKQREMAGKKVSDGRLAHLYRARFNVWPRGMHNYAMEPTSEVLNFIRSQNIKFAKSRSKANT
jgi:superfamily II DNA or RNA helicase